ncbi:hypothetical protein AAFF_G00265940 [Aldrovandia affinis]|uniref:Uncharacterized protein n=1 Tax=Aldrovandia affinis TaxID=143900 RepID=A0AAD7RC02_9TELE|nr:hypothetical protein AAFF_G00265940 [Aldrovandia affinis]
MDLKRKDEGLTGVGRWIRSNGAKTCESGPAPTREPESDCITVIVEHIKSLSRFCFGPGSPLATYYPVTPPSPHTPHTNAQQMRILPRMKGPLIYPCEADFTTTATDPGCEPTCLPSSSSFVFLFLHHTCDLQKFANVDELALEPRAPL